MRVCHITITILSSFFVHCLLAAGFITPAPPICNETPLGAPFRSDPVRILQFYDRYSFGTDYSVNWLVLLICFFHCRAGGAVKVQPEWLTVYKFSKNDLFSVAKVFRCVLTIIIPVRNLKWVYRQTKGWVQKYLQYYR